jgi:hypothetical protein
LAKPFGVSNVGTVVHETFTWALEVPENAALETSAAKRIEKACLRITGVRSARVDAGARTLEVTVALEDLVRGAPPIALPGGPPEGEEPGPGGTMPPPRMRFDTNTLLDVIEKEHLTAAVWIAKEGGAAGPK